MKTSKWANKTKQVQKKQIFPKPFSNIEEMFQRMFSYFQNIFNVFKYFQLYSNINHKIYPWIRLLHCRSRKKGFLGDKWKMRQTKHNGYSNIFTGSGCFKGMLCLQVMHYIHMQYKNCSKRTKKAAGNNGY